jgi:hypothetical protein
LHLLQPVSKSTWKSPIDLGIWGCGKPWETMGNPKPRPEQTWSQNAIGFGPIDRQSFGPLRNPSSIRCVPLTRWNRNVIIRQRAASGCPFLGMDVVTKIVGSFLR